MKLKTLRLGQSHCRADALHKIFSWAPKSAQSFTLLEIKREQYAIRGNRKRPRYYSEFTVTVQYDSAKTHGKYRIKKDWDWVKYSLEGKRYFF